MGTLRFVHATICDHGGNHSLNLMQPHNLSRRDFVRAAVASGALLLPIPASACAPGAAGLTRGQAATGWDAVPDILARIRPPSFPQRDFLVTDYGAVGDGERMGTDAFRRSIEACRAGGWAR